MASVFVPATYRVYRNDVLIASGLMNGAAQFTYVPPDASAANYRVTFSAPGSSSGGSSTIGQRSLSLLGLRR